MFRLQVKYYDNGANRIFRTVVNLKDLLPIVDYYLNNYPNNATIIIREFRINEKKKQL